MDNNKLRKELIQLAKDMRVNGNYFAGSEANWAFHGYADSVEKWLKEWVPDNQKSKPAPKEQKRGNSVQRSRQSTRRG